MGTPPFCYGKVRAGAEAQGAVLRAQGKSPALLFQMSNLKIILFLFPFFKIKNMQVVIL
jgi:hypothetical protein